LNSNSKCQPDVIGYTSKYNLPQEKGDRMTRTKSAFNIIKQKCDCELLNTKNQACVSTNYLLYRINKEAATGSQMLLATTSKQD
jgi:hypothetical protein